MTITGKETPFVWLQADIWNALNFATLSFIFFFLFANGMTFLSLQSNICKNGLKEAYILDGILRYKSGLCSGIEFCLFYV